MRKTYARRCKDAERRGDEAALAKVSQNSVNSQQLYIRLCCFIFSESVRM